MKYEIWVEGYRTWPDHAEATLFGVGEGEDLNAAALDLASRNEVFRKNFDPDRMVWWGCRIFDNETDAREVFG